MTRGRGQPPNPHTAEGLRLVREEGMGPDEAAEQLRGEGKQISGKTIRRAMASSEAPPRPETTRGDQPLRGSSSASSTIPTGQNYRGDAVGATAPRLSPGARSSSWVTERGEAAQPTGAGEGEPHLGPTGGDPRASGLGPSLPPAKLADLRDLIGRLPFAQQDALVTTLPLERLRREAIARGLAPYHEAAAAVARELRAVRL